MKSSRHQSRFICIQALSNYLFTSMTDSLSTILTIQPSQNIDQKFLETLYENAVEHINNLKPVLKTIIKSRRFDNLDYILKSILLLAAHELLIDKMDVGVVINEYVTLTKRFIDDEGDYKLVHKVIHDLNQAQIRHSKQRAQEAFSSETVITEQSELLVECNTQSADVECNTQSAYSVDTPVISMSDCVSVAAISV